MKIILFQSKQFNTIHIQLLWKCKFSNIYFKELGISTAHQSDPFTMDKN